MHLPPGSLVGVGDVISQQLIERRGLAHHNVRRTAKMMSIGFFFVVSGVVVATAPGQNLGSNGSSWDETVLKGQKAQKSTGLGLQTRGGTLGLNDSFGGLRVRWSAAGTKCWTGWWLVGVKALPWRRCWSIRWEAPESPGGGGAGR